MDAIVTPELGFVQVVIATCDPIEKLTTNARIVDTLDLVLAHGGKTPQELFQRILPLFHVVDDLSSDASRSHAARLSCNLWFSCHCSSSWQV